MEAILHMILMGSEIVDKLVDFITANNYMDGNITNNHKESVYTILMGIFCLGLPMTVFRIFCHLHKMKLSERGDNSKDKVHHAINMLTSWAKMLSKLFPKQQLRCFTLATVHQRVPRKPRFKPSTPSLSFPLSCLYFTFFPISMLT